MYVHYRLRTSVAQGPDEPDLTPTRTLDAAELAARIRTGEWVVDLRDRAAYAGRHLAGTVSIGIGKQFCTYAGWVIPWGAPITVIGELGDLAPGVPVRSYEQAPFAEIGYQARILDVRRQDELAEGRIAGAKHIPLDSLVDRAPRGGARRRRLRQRREGWTGGAAMMLAGPR